jgi:hypothetical protein
VRYFVVAPTDGWWKVVCVHEDLIENFVVAKLSEEIGQAEQWARMFAEQLNRGQK